MDGVGKDPAGDVGTMKWDLQLGGRDKRIAGSQKGEQSESRSDGGRRNSHSGTGRLQTARLRSDVGSTEAAARLGYQVGGWEPQGKFAIILLPSKRYFRLVVQVRLFAVFSLFMIIWKEWNFELSH